MSHAYDRSELMLRPIKGLFKLKNYKTYWNNLKFKTSYDTNSNNFGTSFHFQFEISFPPSLQYLDLKNI